ncbi:MAG: hypothetical protein AABW52_02620 [Nanoarchaeota archaeon]
MSLEDKFNPDYGTIVDKVDNALVKVHSQIGDYWQKKTYSSKDKLESYVYGAAALAYASSSALDISYQGFTPGIMASVCLGAFYTWYYGKCMSRCLCCNVFFRVGKTS